MARAVERPKTARSRRPVRAHDATARRIETLVGHGELETALEELPEA